MFTFRPQTAFDGASPEEREAIANFLGDREHQRYATTVTGFDNTLADPDEEEQDDDPAAWQSVVEATRAKLRARRGGDSNQ
jgi:hypothetical protein